MNVQRQSSSIFRSSYVHPQSCGNTIYFVFRPAHDPPCPDPTHPPLPLFIALTAKRARLLQPQAVPISSLVQQMQRPYLHPQSSAPDSRSPYIEQILWSWISTAILIGDSLRTLGMYSSWIHIVNQSSAVTLSMMVGLPVPLRHPRALT